MPSDTTARMVEVPSPVRTSRIQGTGAMADLIRAKDWSETPLGPLASWSDTLVAAVNIVLLSPFSFAIYWGETYTLLYNDVYRAFLDAKHPAALGAPGPQVWQEAWSIIGPPIEAALHSGAGADAHDVLIPILIDGRLQDRWWNYSFYPLYENGRIVGVANPGSAETPRVLAKRALEETQAVLHQALTATRDAVVSVNRNWVLTYLNPAAEKLYGPSRDLVGRNLWEAFPDAVYEGSPFMEHYRRAMNEGIAASFETHYAEPLNFTMSLDVYPSRDGIVTFSRDITELKRATAAVLQNEKLAAVGRLASSIAHEINNPLESVTNLLYLARRSADPAEIDGYLDTAERELRRVSVITNQTLRFYKQTTSPTYVTCLDLFREALSIYQGRLVNSGILVEKRKRASRPAFCFEGEIRQVLSNLIGNAIDAMHPGGGRLLVRSREATDWTSGRKGLALTIADTGTGMPRQLISKIFDAFFTTKGIGGTGLGLWVSREIVDRHAGTLSVRSSQHPTHHGTAIVLFLPFEATSR